MTRTSVLLMTVLTVAFAATFSLAQFRGGRGRGRDRGLSQAVGDWKIDEKFNKDVFTFVRIRYTSWTDGRWRGKWSVDYPDSDVNFSFRLQQLTSLKVDPKPVILDLTDERLFDYPFIYIVEPGQMALSDPEVKALRRYLLNGGFLMVDDFWGEREYAVFASEMKRVFPNRSLTELPLDHDIFHCVYPLNEKPQIPSVNAALGGRHAGITWERHDAREVHYQGVYDDDGRLMMIVCHNTDLGDGWEREGVDEWYFHEFSEKKAYPLGINIITYAMTH